MAPPGLDTALAGAWTLADGRLDVDTPLPMLKERYSVVRVLHEGSYCQVMSGIGSGRTKRLQMGLCYQ